MDKFCEDCIHNAVCQYGAIPPHIGRCNDKDTLDDMWTPIDEMLPEEHEWIGTKTFGTTISDEVYVTFESPEGERFTKHLSFQNGKMSDFVQKEIDAFHKGSVPIAWMPLPEPYKGSGAEE